MAAMSTALTEFSTIGNSRTYTTTGHTITAPKLVMQKRRVPSGKQVMSETSIQVVQSTVDVDGYTLPDRVSAEIKFKFPIGGETAIRDAVLVIIRDLIASDEVTATVADQNFVA